METFVKWLLRVSNALLTLALILTLLFALNGCKAPKTIIEVQKDTIYKSEVLKIQPKQLNSIALEGICDSLGNLTPMNYTFRSDKVKTVLRTVNDTLYLEQDIDSIVDSKVSEYRSTLKDKTVEITKFKVPKWAYYSLLINLGLLAWTFRKRLGIPL